MFGSTPMQHAEMTFPLLYLESVSVRQALLPLIEYRTVRSQVLGTADSRLVHPRPRREDAKSVLLRVAITFPHAATVDKNDPLAFLSAILLAHKGII